MCVRVNTICMCVCLLMSCKVTHACTFQNGTIKELFDELSKQLPDHDFQLITGTQQLQREDNKTLAELGITHLSTLTVVARFCGGYSNLFYSLHAILYVII